MSIEDLVPLAEKEQEAIQGLAKGEAMTKDEARRRMLHIMGELYNVVGHRADGTGIWQLLDDYYGDVSAALEAEPLAVVGGRVEVDEDGWGHLTIVETWKATAPINDPIVTVTITKKVESHDA